MPTYAGPMPCSDRVDWLSRAALELVPVGPVDATLDAPSSKSLTNRLLVIAGLADGTSVLRRPLVSDDTAAMSSGLRALGARIESLDDATRVTGTSGRPVAGGTVSGRGAFGDHATFLGRSRAPHERDRGPRRARIPSPAPDRSSRRGLARRRGGRLDRRRKAAASDLEPRAGRRQAPGRRRGQQPVRHGVAPCRPLCRRGPRPRGGGTARARLRASHGQRHGSVGGVGHRGGGRSLPRRGRANPTSQEKRRSSTMPALRRTSMRSASPRGGRSLSPTPSRASSRTGASWRFSPPWAPPSIGAPVGRR